MEAVLVVDDDPNVLAAHRRALRQFNVTYALDGYVSIIGVHLLWRVSGHLVKRYETVDQAVLSFSPALVRPIPEPAPRSVAEAP